MQRSQHDEDQETVPKATSPYIWPIRFAILRKTNWFPPVYIQALVLMVRMNICMQMNTMNVLDGATVGVMMTKTRRREDGGITNI